MTTRFQWASVHEWLYWKVDQETDLVWLRDTARDLAGKLDSDQLQDIFEGEMDQDGYFDTIETRVNPDCPDCRGTGCVYQSTGAFSYRAPCLCNPEHGSHHR